MKELRFALVGAGFWSTYQLAGWMELPGLRCVAICNRTLAKARALAERFGVPAVFDDLGVMLTSEKLDFVDIVTGEDSHAEFTRLAARHKVPVICQKPMARDYPEALSMVKASRAHGVPLFIHENWRFQSGLRALGACLHSGAIGEPYHARLDFRTGFDVFANQPFLATLPRFILTDIGSHTLDTARWLFGEPTHLFAQTKRVHRHIAGEDVATVQLALPAMAVTVNMSYAGNAYEVDRFPETFAFVEGELGSIELGPDCTLRLSTVQGTRVSRHPPADYPWVDPKYRLVQSSIVDCNAQILRQLRGEGQAETTGEDNLKTVRLVQACYASAASGTSIRL